MNCRSCGAPVIMGSLNGKAHPVDAEPTDKGNLARFDDLMDPDRRGPVFSHIGADGEVKLKVTIGAHAVLPLIYTGARYTSHFATCPQAAEWRS